MFNFFKKIFKKKKHIQSITVDLHNLRDFFSKEKTKLLPQITQEIDNLKLDIQSEIEKTKTNVERLKNAQLRNTKIPEREIHFMKGNRESYVKKAAQFIQSVEVKKDLSTIKDGYLEFEKYLYTYGKATFRPYSILQHFFAEESSSIAQNIKQIEELYKKIIEVLKQHNYDLISVTEQSIDNLFYKISHKKELEKEISNKKAELEKLKKDIETSDCELSKLKKSKLYEEYVHSTTQKEIINEKLHNHNTIIIHSFSIIEQAQKKYVRIAFEDEKLCQSYLNDPVQSIISDKELKIITILDKIKENIMHNKINLKEKKKEKTIDELQKLNKEFFTTFLEERKKIENEYNITIKTLNENPIMIQINEKEDQLSHFKTKQEHADRHLKEVIDKKNKIKIEKLKNELQEKLNTLFSVKSTIP